MSNLTPSTERELIETLLHSVVDYYCGVRRKTLGELDDLLHLVLIKTYYCAILELKYAHRQTEYINFGGVGRWKYRYYNELIELIERDLFNHIKLHNTVDKHDAHLGRCRSICFVPTLEELRKLDKLIQLRKL